MLDFARARALLIEAAQPIERRATLPIEACLGRTLAADARCTSGK